MKLRIWVIVAILVMVLSVSGCSSEADAEGPYSVKFNDIEHEDTTALLEILSDKTQPAISTYEVKDPEDERYVYYVYSRDHNFAQIEQVGGMLHITVQKLDNVIEKQLLLKINYDPEVIKDFSVTAE